MNVNRILRTHCLPIERNELSPCRPIAMRFIIRRTDPGSLRIRPDEMRPIMLDQIHHRLFQQPIGCILRKLKLVLIVGKRDFFQIGVNQKRPIEFIAQIFEKRGKVFDGFGVKCWHGSRHTYRFVRCDWHMRGFGSVLALPGRAIPIG